MKSRIEVRILGREQQVNVPLAKLVKRAVLKTQYSRSKKRQEKGKTRGTICPLIAAVKRAERRAAGTRYSSAG